MNLQELIFSISVDERFRLAEKIGKSPRYLYFLAAHPHRKVGPQTCIDLAKADSRLSLAEMRPDIWGPTAMRVWRPAQKKKKKG